MWIDSVVETLRAIIKRLGLGSKKTAAKLRSIRNGAAQEKTPNPLPPPIGDEVRSRIHPTGHANSESLGQPELSSDDQVPEKVPPQSTNLTEANPDESSIVDSLTSNVEKQSPPKADEHAKNSELNGSDARSSGTKNSRNSQRGPRRIQGQRGLKHGKKEIAKQSPTTSRPDLVCRRVFASMCWEVVLCADEERKVLAAHLEGKPLDFTGGECPVPLLRGRLTVSCRDEQDHIVPLFEGAPLIFKLRKNWAGEGRRIAQITSGYFIVIAPVAWNRIGSAPVESDGCVDPSFQAHYFYWSPNESDRIDDGFHEWRDQLIATGIELTGGQIHDDSADGVLFVGDAPILKSSTEIDWARVGEETEQGWGENFRPEGQSLPEVLDGKEGRFFLRVYDSNVNMLDSVAFRYVRNLRRIEINGEEYGLDSVLTPTDTGYPTAKVRLLGADGSSLTPTLALQAHQTIAADGTIIVPPHPGADRITCNLKSGANHLNIVIDLPRIWWRLEDSESNIGEWRDTPLTMTREEFTSHAYTDMTLLILSRRHESVRVGFDDEPGQPYRRKIEEAHIKVPLDHFADHDQICRRLMIEAHLKVVLAGTPVSLIVISADPMPEIVSFTAEPATILVGEKTALKWTTHNADGGRVVIDPEPGVVQNDGTHTVNPNETTLYTLILTFPDMDDISKSVTVAVDSHSQPCWQCSASVMSPAGGWRKGRGFSIGELQCAGLDVREAIGRSLPVDKRRRTSHRANVNTIRSMFDG